jgi:hypothetical protein
LEKIAMDKGSVEQPPAASEKKQKKKPFLNIGS